MTSSVERFYDAGNHELYVFFGGINAGIQIPPFEFYRAAGILEQNKLFVRDLDQCWYQTGLFGVSTDVFSTSKFLAMEISRLAPQRTIFVGSSMGGYAAILFAALVGVEFAVAFAPQTFIDPWLRLRHRDKRWSKQIRRAQMKTAIRKKIWDLKPWLIESPRSLSVDIYYPGRNRLDMAHAQRLAKISGIALTAVDSGDHNLVKALRDSGRLTEILHDPGRR